MLDLVWKRAMEARRRMKRVGQAQEAPGGPRRPQEGLDGALQRVHGLRVVLLLLDELRVLLRGPGLGLSEKRKSDPMNKCP